MFSSVGLNQASPEVCEIKIVSTRPPAPDVWERVKNTDLLEDIVEKGVVAVVVHVPEY